MLSRFDFLSFVTPIIFLKIRQSLGRVPPASDVRCLARAITAAEFNVFSTGAAPSCCQKRPAKQGSEYTHGYRTPLFARFTLALADGDARLDQPEVLLAAHSI